MNVDEIGHIAGPAPFAPTWFKSSYSNGAGGECLECAVADDSVLTRDSKCADGNVIPFAPQAWVHFVRSLHRSVQESYLR